MKLKDLSEPLQNMQQIHLYFIWKLTFKSNGAAESYPNLTENDQRTGNRSQGGQGGQLKGDSQTQGKLAAHSAELQDH